MENKRKIYSEDVNYWKTSKTAPDTWINKAIKEIEKAGGIVIARGNAMDIVSGEAFMLKFNFGQDCFHVIWPVLESKTGNELAARRQSATMLYHDVKAKCISAKIIGIRRSFVAFLVLEDGYTMDRKIVDHELLVPLLVGGE